MTEPSVAHERKRAVVNSALWAAWGDALGFITELTDDGGVQRRLAGRPLGVVPWRRRVGGRGGVNVELPAGTYSDDTQLRLAVGRCIGPNGFDVEAFARVELTVWPAYALGGGFASKAGAAAMARPGARWSTNSSSAYTNAGGNGVAMRVQPHVWRSPADASDEDLLLDVLRDGVTTHGHPRALLGAGLHALALADVLPGGAHTLLAGSGAWAQLINRLLLFATLPSEDMELAAFWVTQWRHPQFAGWRAAVEQTVQEISEQAEQVASAVDASTGLEEGYRRVSDVLRLLDPSHRGSGSRTSLATLAVLALARRHDASTSAALTAVASVIGSDTDTVATMAGALLACVDTVPPPDSLLDRDYLEREGQRLADGGGQPPVRYPDLLTWQAPKTQADVLRRADEEGHALLVSGLGRAEPLGAPLEAPKGDFAWQWVRLDFGQTLLIKRRLGLPVALATEWPTGGPGSASVAPSDGEGRPSRPRADVQAERPAENAVTADGETSGSGPVAASDDPGVRPPEPATPSGVDGAAPPVFGRGPSTGADAARPTRREDDVLGSPLPASKPSRDAEPRPEVPVRARHPQVAPVEESLNTPGPAEAIARAMSVVRTSNFEVRQIGLMLVRLATDYGPEVAAAYGALVSTEIARLRRRGEAPR